MLWQQGRAAGEDLPELVWEGPEPTASLAPLLDLPEAEQQERMLANKAAFERTLTDPGE